mmetsp:Transcript_86135/g.238721  ORF Transcript_86135/g.238721 Transcript_86135/m.238721 type:complete len:300 (-) Transcript_86135:120-1019(-)
MPPSTALGSVTDATSTLGDGTAACVGTSSSPRAYGKGLSIAHLHTASRAAACLGSSPPSLTWEEASSSRVASGVEDLVTPARAVSRRQVHLRSVRWLSPLRSDKDVCSSRRRSIGSAGPPLSRQASPAAHGFRLEASSRTPTNLRGSLDMEVTSAVAQVASRRSIGSMGPPLSRHSSLTRRGILAEGHSNSSLMSSMCRIHVDKTAAAATALAAAANAAAAAATAAAAAANLLASAEFDRGCAGGSIGLLASESGDLHSASPHGPLCDSVLACQKRAAPAALDAVRGGGPVKARFDLFF